MENARQPRCTKTTVGPIASKEIIDIESGNCNGDCSTNHCPCKRPPGRACSQICTCNDSHYIDSNMTVMVRWKNRMQHAINIYILICCLLEVVFFSKKLTFGPPDVKIGPVTSHRNEPILNDL